MATKSLKKWTKF